MGYINYTYYKIIIKLKLTEEIQICEVNISFMYSVLEILY